MMIIKLLLLVLMGWCGLLLGLWILILMVSRAAPYRVRFVDVAFVQLDRLIEEACPMDFVAFMLA